MVNKWIGANMIKLAICDDEKNQIDVLKNDITAFLELNKEEYLIDEFVSGEDLLRNLDFSCEYYDIIFLDIKMQKINGMETAKFIREKNMKTAIVFVSALKEYVFDAFDVSAVSFLVKPVKTSKLYSVLTKILKSENYSNAQFIMLKTKDRVNKVFMQDIIYCEVLNHKVFVYEKSLVHDYSGNINSLELELSKEFFRCHRSYIVNLQHVQSYKDGFAYMSGKEKIPIATRRQKEFLKALLHINTSEVLV